MPDGQIVHKYPHHCKDQVVVAWHILHTDGEYAVHFQLPRLVAAGHMLHFDRCGRQIVGLIISYTAITSSGY